MNGDTKLRLKGGFYGAIITVFVTFIAFVFGYGILNNRVEALEEKTDCLKEIHEDIATIKNDIGWMKNRL